MAGRVTTADKTRMRKLASQGLSEREIAAKIGRSRDTVKRCMAGMLTRGGGAKASAAVVPTEVQPAPAGTPGGATDARDAPAAAPVAAGIEEQREMLSSMLRTAMDAAKGAAAVGNDTLALSYGRQGAGLAAALRRLNPREKDDESEIVKVRITDMDAAALRGRERLFDQLGKLVAMRDEWPKCPHCGAPMQPQETTDPKDTKDTKEAKDA